MSSGESEERSDRFEDIDCRAVRAWMFGLRKLGKYYGSLLKGRQPWVQPLLSKNRKKNATGKVMNCDAQKMAEQK